jgi:hypothetical protein
MTMELIIIGGSLTLCLLVIFCAWCAVVALRNQKRAAREEGLAPIRDKLGAELQGMTVGEAVEHFKTRYPEITVHILPDVPDDGKEFDDTPSGAFWNSNTGFAVVLYMKQSPQEPLTQFDVGRDTVWIGFVF